MTILDSSGRPFDPKPDCNHDPIPVTFDEGAAHGLSAEEVRKRWPRGFSVCSDCGASVIKYASFAHYIAGDW